ncbi:MAG TPA: hypothetical protein PLO51_00865 [Candidatus Micrarchaeota archaeon]|nr:hypothetical protein [Candidatus Micrarchaeota archaeon]
MEKAEMESRIAELENKKSALIEKVKVLNATIRAKERQLEYAAGIDRDAPRPSDIARELEQMEFRIATTAYTSKIEKEMIKSVKDLQKQLEDAREAERKRKKLMYAEGDLKTALEERAKIEKELTDIRTELKALYGSKKDMANSERKEKSETGRRQYHDESRKRQDREFREENAQHLKPFERFVSLEEIVHMKKSGESG